MNATLPLHSVSESRPLKRTRRKRAEMERYRLCVADILEEIQPARVFRTRGTYKVSLGLEVNKNISFTTASVNCP